MVCGVLFDIADRKGHGLWGVLPIGPVRNAIVHGEAVRTKPVTLRESRGSAFCFARLDTRLHKKSWFMG